MQRDELGALISLEMGKILTEGEGEVQEFVDIVSRPGSPCRQNLFELWRRPTMPLACRG